MKGKGFGGGMQQLMRQANQMQNKMKKLQEELATREFEGQAGGGALQVKVNGENKITAVQIDPEVVSGDDVDMLQDMFMAAANDALAEAKKVSDEEMSKITGGMSMPGMF